ncbi:hypothetical protein N0V90_000989 [Kalmusia sp. IMI 367209]|nr:hypothetical protein N0V90_000989 [Kalmusia sp. IMI 367209]
MSSKVAQVSAIDFLPNDTTIHQILILAGNYTEQLNITRQGPVRLIGQTAKPTDQSRNQVTVYWAAAKGKGSKFSDNAFTSVLTVAPTLNASLTGASPTGFDVPPDTPFGNLDFRAYNIDFRNVFAEQAAGPSLTVSISRSNAGFYRCGIYSYQDTVYIGHLGNTYLYGGEIAGQTDFLYGFGTAWVEKTKLTLRGCKGGVIAWKGTNTTFANKYGCYVARSSIEAANASVAAEYDGHCALGRPWNELHRSVYIDSFMDTTVLPRGYIKWRESNDSTKSNYGNSTFMAEYGSYGPGWNRAARGVGNVTIVLDEQTVKPYLNPREVFMTPDGQQPNVEWIDEAFYPYPY